MTKIFYLLDSGLQQNNLTSLTVNSSASRLDTLLLSQNQISSTLEDLGKLTNITWIDITANRFAGPVPVSFRNLSRLSYFFANDNKLNGTFPAVLKDMAALQEVQLAGNLFVGELADAFPPSLRSIDFSRNSNMRGCFGAPRNFTCLNMPLVAADMCACDFPQLSACTIRNCSCPGQRPDPNYYCSSKESEWERSSTSAKTPPAAPPTPSSFGAGNSTIQIDIPIRIPGNLTVQATTSTLAIAPTALAAAQLGNSSLVSVAGCVTFSGVLEVSLAANTTITSDTTVNLFSFDGYCGGQQTRFSSESVTIGCRKVQATFNYYPKLLSVVISPNFDDSGCANAKTDAQVSLPVSAIAGGAVGGLILLVAIVVLVILLAVPACRRKVFPYRESRKLKTAEERDLEPI